MYRLDEKFLSMDGYAAFSLNSNTSQNDFMTGHHIPFSRSDSLFLFFHWTLFLSVCLFLTYISCCSCCLPIFNQQKSVIDTCWTLRHQQTHRMKMDEAKEKKKEKKNKWNMEQTQRKEHYMIEHFNKILGRQNESINKKNPLVDYLISIFASFFSFLLYQKQISNYFDIFSSWFTHQSGGFVTCAFTIRSLTLFPPYTNTIFCFEIEHSL